MSVFISIIQIHKLRRNQQQMSRFWNLLETEAADILSLNLICSNHWLYETLETLKKWTFLFVLQSSTENQLNNDMHLPHCFCLHSGEIQWLFQCKNSLKSLPTTNNHTKFQCLQTRGSWSESQSYGNSIASYKVMKTDLKGKHTKLDEVFRCAQF